jgi:hypothetical protein
MADGTLSTGPGFVTNAVSIATSASGFLALLADGTVFAPPGYVPNDLTNIPPALYANTVSRSGNLDTNSPGIYLLTYNATNVFGVAAPSPVTRTLVVTDTTTPTVTLNGSSPFTLAQDAAFIDPGATALDICAGNISGSIQVLGSVNTARAGSYNLTYLATDPSGNIGTTNRAVWVIPSVSPASSVSTSTGVNPNGSDTFAWYQYGLTTNYGLTTPTQDLGSGTSLVTVNATFSNLLPGTTYHYRLVTTNVVTGLVYGPDMTFTTSPYLVPGDLNGDGIVDQSELNLLLTNYWEGSPWLSMTNNFGLGSTNNLFSLTNANNFDLSVLVSTNLLDWDYLGVAHQRYQFFDPDATNAPVRFYRLRWP